MSVKQHPEPQSTNTEALADETRIDGQAALVHAAYVAAKIAIARWQESSRQSYLNLSVPHNQSTRARWYARTQQGLQDWIDRGGFAQAVDSHDGAALSGAHGVRPTLYRVPGTNPRCSGSCMQ